jgi:hypothetical protein
MKWMENLEGLPRSVETSIGMERRLGVQASCLAMPAQILGTSGWGRKTGQGHPVSANRRTVLWASPALLTQRSYPSHRSCVVLYAGRGKYNQAAADAPSWRMGILIMWFGSCWTGIA